jgi:hypothetical protein
VANEELEELVISEGSMYFISSTRENGKAYEMQRLINSKRPALGNCRVQQWKMQGDGNHTNRKPYEWLEAWKSFGLKV